MWIGEFEPRGVQLPRLAHKAIQEGLVVKIEGCRSRGLRDRLGVAGAEWQRNLPIAVYLETRVDEDRVGFGPGKVAVGLDAVKTFEQPTPPRRKFRLSCRSGFIAFRAGQLNHVVGFHRDARPCTREGE